MDWFALTGAASVGVLDLKAAWFRAQPADVRRRLEGLIEEATDIVWFGPRATRFRTFLDGPMVWSLNQLEAAFIEAGDMLAEQAAQQREASAFRPENFLSGGLAPARQQV